MSNSYFTFIGSFAPWYIYCWNGWLLWIFIARFVMKIKHPPVRDTSPIGTTRMIIGFIALIIFFLSFSYNGIYFIGEDGMPGIMGF